MPGAAMYGFSYGRDSASILFIIDPSEQKRNGLILK